MLCNAFGVKTSLRVAWLFVQRPRRKEFPAGRLAVLYNAFGVNGALP